jgi:hypothetical protein
MPAAASSAFTLQTIPVLVPSQRRNDRDLIRHEDCVEQVTPQAGHAGDQPKLRDPLRDEQAAVDPGQPDGVDPEVTQPGDQLTVDDPAQHRGGHLERLGIGDTQAAFEPGRDAEPFKPLGDALATAVDEHDRPAARTAATSASTYDCSASCCRRADDDDLDIRSCTPSSITYSCVVAAEGSPVPSPSPRSKQIQFQCVHSRTRGRAVEGGSGRPARRRTPGDRRWRYEATSGRAWRAGWHRLQRHGRQPGCRGRGRAVAASRALHDPPPVGVLAVGRT